MSGDDLYLRHILDAAQKAVAISLDYERSDLGTNDLLGLALVRLLEVIGEAANNVNPDTQRANPAIP